MPFKEVVAAGMYLVREALRSPNFVTGVAGWTINRDGSAEFSNAIFRGTVNVGTTDGTDGRTGVQIINQGGQAQIRLYSGATDELFPAAIFATAVGIDPVLVVASATATPDQGEFQTQVQPANSPNRGFYDFVHTGPGGGFADGIDGIVRVASNINWRFVSSYLMTGVADTNVPVRIGNSASVNLVMDAQDIQALNNSTPAGLFLNFFGGSVQLGNVGNTDNFITQIIANIRAMSLASTNHGWQIGFSSGSNLRADSSNIQSANNGVAAALGLNPFGGAINTGTGLFTTGGSAVITDDLTVNGTTLTVNADEDLNGNLDVSGTSTLGGVVTENAGTVSTTMRAQSATDSNSRTTASTTYVDAGTTATLTLSVPPSQRILVSVRGRLSNTSVTATHAAALSFEVRNQNSTGTVLVAASDANACVGTAYATSTTDVTFANGGVVVNPGAAASGTYFVRLMLRSNNAANTASCLQSLLTVVPIP